MTALQPHGVKLRREARGWSQAELATRAGISRPSVSAIEGRRLVPSVETALALARVFETTVEDLFGEPSQQTPCWAWAPARTPWRFWQAEIGGKSLLIPVEDTSLRGLPHDGVAETPQSQPELMRLASQTLVLAACDPAADLLAAEYQRQTGMRMVVLSRASRAALELLKQGLVHVAGIHLSSEQRPSGNEDQVREQLGAGYSLIRGAAWETGLAVGNSVSSKSVSAIARSPVTWVGREAGSGARRLLDELLPESRTPQHIARDHRGVADAIRTGWAEAGVCVRLVSEEAGLRFLGVQQDAYDLCCATASLHDPRIRGLMTVLKSLEYRQMISELPGYSIPEIGSLREVTAMEEG